MDWGGIIASALGGGAREATAMATEGMRVDQSKDLARYQSDLEEQKQLRVAEAAQQLAMRGRQIERDRVAGIIGTKMGRDAENALTASGDLEAAKNYRSLQGEGVSVTPWGGIKSDPYGGVVTDNGAELRGSIEEAKAAAKRAAAGDKMPEGDKIELQSHYTRLNKIQEQLDDARKQPGYDPKGQGIQELLQEREILNTKVGILRGTITGQRQAEELLKRTSDPTALAQSIQQAYMLNPKFGAEFDAVIRASGKLDAKPAPAAPGAPKPGAAAAAAAPAVAPEPDMPEGAALDQARKAYDTARATFMAYGSRQRQKDPEGFAKAKSAFDAAQMARAEAETAYQRAMAKSPFARSIPMAQP